MVGARFRRSLIGMALVLLIGIGGGLMVWAQLESIEAYDFVQYTGAQAYQTQQITGKEAIVGVIDMGFKGLPADQFITYDPMRPPEEETDHGTAVIRIIRKIAPDATVVACRYTSVGGFEDCVQEMMRKGVHIINHSLGVPIASTLNEHPWTTIVERELDVPAPPLWINAAGNFGNRCESLPVIPYNNNFLMFAGALEDPTKKIYKLAPTNDATTIFVTSAEQGIEMALFVNDAQGEPVGDGYTYRKIIPRPDGDTVSIQIRFLGDRIPEKVYLCIEHLLEPTGDDIEMAPANSPIVLNVGAVEEGVEEFERYTTSANPPDLLVYEKTYDLGGTSAAAAVASGLAALLVDEEFDNVRDLYWIMVEEYAQRSQRSTAPELRLPDPNPLGTPASVSTQPPTADVSIPMATFSSNAAADEPMQTVVDANLREYPGFEYKIVGHVRAYVRLEPRLVSADGRWYFVVLDTQNPIRPFNMSPDAFASMPDGGAWISAGAVRVGNDLVESLSSFAPPTLTPTATLSQPTATYERIILPDTGHGWLMPVLEPGITPTPRPTHTPTISPTPRVGVSTEGQEVEATNRGNFNLGAGCPFNILSVKQRYDPIEKKYYTWYLIEELCTGNNGQGYIRGDKVALALNDEDIEVLRRIYTPPTATQIPSPTNTPEATPEPQLTVTESVEPPPDDNNNNNNNNNNPQPVESPTPQPVVGVTLATATP